MAIVVDRVDRSWLFWICVMRLMDFVCVCACMWFHMSNFFIQCVVAIKLEKNILK